VATAGLRPTATPGRFGWLSRQVAKQPHLCRHGGNDLRILPRKQTDRRPSPHQPRENISAVVQDCGQNPQSDGREDQKSKAKCWWQTVSLTASSNKCLRNRSAHRSPAIDWQNVHRILNLISGCAGQIAHRSHRIPPNEKPWAPPGPDPSSAIVFGGRIPPTPRCSNAIGGATAAPRCFLRGTLRDPLAISFENQ